MLKGAGSASALDATQVVRRAGAGRGTLPASDWALVQLAVLASQGRSFEALVACHDIQRAGQTRTDEGQDVRDLQVCLEKVLLVQDIELVAKDLRIRPIESDKVLIGRPSKAGNVDIAINCGWFSRGQRSLVLRRADTSWLLRDVGSSNGSFIGDKALIPGDEYALPLGLTTVEIGRSDDQRAPVVLNVIKLAAGPAIVRVGVGAGFQKEGRYTWPSLEEDIRTCWIAFQDQLALRVADLVPGQGGTREQGAVLSYLAGYWISPLPMADLRVNGIQIFYPVPLPANAVVDANGWSLRTESISVHD